MWNFKSLQKPLVFLFLLCLFPLGALAQGTVTGTVNDEAGEPIIGASVQVQGTKTGAITDFNGNFSVQAGSNATLVISYIGYTSATVKVNGRNNITVVLKEDAQTLQDVVMANTGIGQLASVSKQIKQFIKVLPPAFADPRCQTPTFAIVLHCLFQNLIYDAVRPLDALEQILEGQRFELAGLEQNPVSAAQP